MSQSTQEKSTLKQINYGDLCYLINFDDKTAKVVGDQKTNSNILIPRSIKYESTEYIVTSISKRSFLYSKTIKSIRLSDDSELQTIEKEAFYESSIESISLSSQFVDLQEGWCSNTPSLTEIRVNENNCYYTTDVNKYLLKKSSIERENYDVLVFAPRNIKNADIPDFIEIIGPYAFQNNNVSIVSISKESKLQKIDKFAFSRSNIRAINIPSNVKIIGENSFSFY